MSPRLRVLVCSSSVVVTVCVQTTLTQMEGTPEPAEVVKGTVSGVLEQYLLRRDRDGCDVVVLHDPGATQLDRQLVQLVPLVLAVGYGDLDGPDMLRALRMGVRNFVSIDHDLEALYRACEEATHGRGYVSPDLVAVLAEHLSGASPHRRSKFGLTAREDQVLRLLSDGHSTTVIARQLRITPRTAKHHLSSIYRKLGVTSSAEALVHAYREGLVG